MYLMRNDYEYENHIKYIDYRLENYINLFYYNLFFYLSNKNYDKIIVINRFIMIQLNVNNVTKICFILFILPNSK